MEAKIEARVRRTSPTRGKASVHIVFDEASGMTISNMEVWEEDGKLTVKMPPPGRRQRYGATMSSVERALRNLICAVWERTDHVLLEHIAGAALRRPPTNSEFIDMLAGYLRKAR